jgi:hypothetical protein
MMLFKKCYKKWGGIGMTHDHPYKNAFIIVFELSTKSFKKITFNYIIDECDNDIFVYEPSINIITMKQAYEIIGAKLFTIMVRENIYNEEDLFKFIVEMSQ